MQRHTLSIENLSISFQHHEKPYFAVRNLSLQIAPGETLALVGESGSGKSLTGLSVLGLLPDTAKMSGTITVAGHNVQLFAEKDFVQLRRQHVALIMQEPMAALNPSMRVGEQVKEAVVVAGNMSSAKAHEKIMELFVEVGLGQDFEKFYNAYPHELSGGQLQRSMIAIALARDPQLLIADEPTTALDVRVQKQILQLLKTLQAKRGMAMLFISHDLAVVAQLAQKVIVLKQGHVIEQGSTQNVLYNPQKNYTKNLLAAYPENKAPKSFLVTDQTFDSKNILTQTPRAVIEIRNLHAYYGNKTLKNPVHALNDVTLHLQRGETLGIVGESGSGKSTIAKCLFGLGPSYQGSIQLFGTDLQTASKSNKSALMRRCQIIFQNSEASLNPRLPIGTLLEEPFLLHNITPPEGVACRIRSLLAETGLTEDMLHRYPQQLSGGQRQRVNIARALASNPEVLVCDEAVSALDISVQAKIIDLLLHIQRERGLSIIFISHNLLITRHISDRICVLHQGKIVEQGNAVDMLKHPESAYTQQLVQACPFLYTAA